MTNHESPVTNPKSEIQNPKLPAPVFHDPKHHIKIYQGDCLEILALIPENSVDLIFADPPYFLSNDGITCHAGKMVSVNKGEWDRPSTLLAPRLSLGALSRAERGAVSLSNGSRGPDALGTLCFKSLSRRGRIRAIMGLGRIPKRVRAKFQFDERGHACSILASDFPAEFQDIVECLDSFVLRKRHILTPGGGKSPISAGIDKFLRGRNWAEKSFDIKILIDGEPIPTPTHKIDNFRNRVGLEVEWNNKTEFYDRDLNNFRLLKELRVLDVGVIVTRLSELQGLFDRLGKGVSYGASTTHWDKLIPKVDGGGAGGCPLLLVGMGMKCYDPHS